MEQPSDKKVTISIKQITGAIEINLSSDDAKTLLSNYKTVLKALDENADLLKGIYGKLGGAPLKLAETGHIVVPSALGQTSIAEMMKKSGAKKGTDRVLLIAYYLYKVNGVGTLNSTDIKDSFAKARLPDPKNLSQTINNLLKLGKLRPADDKDDQKGFAITQTGEEEAGTLLGKPTKE